MGGLLRRRGFAVPAVTMLIATSLLGACQAAASPSAAGSSGGAASPATSGAQTTWQKILQQKFVRVGFANEAPYDFADSNGKLTGTEPEILRAFLTSQGITELDGSLTDFGSLIPGLLANRFDIIAAAMNIRSARCAQIAFSEPTSYTPAVFAVKKGNPLNLHTFADVAKSATAKFGVAVGSSELALATVAGVPDARLIKFEGGPNMIAGLQAGRVDVISLVHLSMTDLLSKTNDPNIELVELTSQPLDANGKVSAGYGGMGFRLADTDFLKAFNDWLGTAKANGDLLKLVSPFGETKLDIPGPDVTTAQRCAQ